MLKSIKNMAVVGIVDKEGTSLYKIAVWDNSFLDIKFKICTKEEMDKLAKAYVPIDSYNTSILKKKLVTVPYVSIFEPMMIAWINDTCSFMYSYFDCLRWCLYEGIKFSVNGTQITKDSIKVDLENREVWAGNILLFTNTPSPWSAPLTIDVTSLTPEQYDIAAREFNLDGTEETFEYKPVECISSRNSCSILCNYAINQDCIGNLYALDQILGDL